jgi:uncharacterized protein
VGSLFKIKQTEEMKHIYIFPRYSGNENSDWYQQAANELNAKKDEYNVTILNLPNWEKPDPEEFLAFIKTKVPAVQLDENSYFIGHSVGCKAALLYLDFLAKTNVGLKIGGLLCIAGWWTVDKAWEQLKLWIDQPIDYPRIKETCNHNIDCLLSDRDPYTRDTQSNKKEWEEKLDAMVNIIHKAKHFNTEAYTEIMNEISLFTNKSQLK